MFTYLFTVEKLRTEERLEYSHILRKLISSVTNKELPSSFVKMNTAW